MVDLDSQGEQVLHWVMSMNAWSKSNLQVFLIKNWVIVSKKVQSQNPLIHVLVVHDHDCAHAILSNNIWFFWKEVNAIVDCEPHIWEHIVLIFRAPCVWNDIDDEIHLWSICDIFQKSIEIISRKQDERSSTVNNYRSLHILISCFILVPFQVELLHCYLPICWVRVDIMPDDITCGKFFKIISTERNFRLLFMHSNRKWEHCFINSSCLFHFFNEKVWFFFEMIWAHTNNTWACKSIQAWLSIDNNKVEILATKLWGDADLILRSISVNWSRSII